eukprot:763403-Hanusia_phi.AAC.4
MSYLPTRPAEANGQVDFAILPQDVDGVFQIPLSRVYMSSSTYFGFMELMGNDRIDVPFLPHPPLCASFELERLECRDTQGCRFRMDGQRMLPSQVGAQA